MTKPVEVYATGFKEVGELIQQRFIGDPKSQKAAILKALWVGAQPMAQAAKSNYIAIQGSGATAASVRTYRWKNNTELGKGIRVGPKRSIRTALYKWIFHYRRPISPGTFAYGLRHAHLVEFGFRHNFSGFRKIPGKYPLTKAKNSAKGRIAPIAKKDLDVIIRKRTELVMRRKTRQRLR